MKRLSQQALADRAIRLALREDLGAGDATTRSLVPPGSRGRALIVAREPGVVAGLAAARAVFRRVDPSLRVTAAARDGDIARAGMAVLRLSGSARGILTGERAALNFLQRMSGIATLTRRYVEALHPLPVRVLDTRKTTPGLRVFEKAAVRSGGGENHRFGLDDRILIKDNHRAFWSAGAGRARLADAVRAARRRYPGLPIEIEVESESELRDALEGRPDWILLDNQSIASLRRCVRLTAGRARLEASGGITLETARRIAETGVDAISVGALTHSARAMDYSLEWRG